MTGRFARRMLRRLGDSTGANLVEAAIITPLLLLVTFSIVEFGALFYVFLALENGVSQASRYGVTGQQMQDMSREESIKTAMRQFTPTLTIDDTAFTFTHLPAGGASWMAGSGGPNDIGRVTVNYSWNIFTPVMRPFFEDGRVMLRVESAMKNEPRFQE